MSLKMQNSTKESHLSVFTYQIPLVFRFNEMPGSCLGKSYSFTHSCFIQLRTKNKFPIENKSFAVHLCQNRKFIQQKYAIEKNVIFFFHDIRLIVAFSPASRITSDWIKVIYCLYAVIVDILLGE